MTAFRWQGTDALGLPQRGVLNAASRDAAKAQLSALGVSALVISNSADSKKASDVVPPQAGARNRTEIRLSRKQLVLFCRHLANLLVAGIPVVDALDTLKKGSKGDYAKLLLSIHNSLDDGLKLGDAMALHSQVFDPYAVSLVRCEEVAGQIHRALATLANHLEQSQALHQKVRQSLLQPGLILLTAIMVSWLLLTFVMPEFVKMYSQQNQQLPVITQWVMGVSDRLQEHSISALLLISMAGAGGITLYQRVGRFRLLFDQLILRLPLLGDLSRLSNLVDLSRTLAAMLTAGVSLNEALTHTAASCRNAAFCQAVLNATAKVESGSSLHQAMTGSQYFPEAFRRMIQLGEETGKLSQMFEHAARGYQEEIRRSIDCLLPLIEPILMLILGMMIGGLILAMYLPIFAMGSLL